MTETSENTKEPLEKGDYGGLVDEVGKTPSTRRRYFQMFDAHFIAKKPVHEIAKDFGVSKKTVYLAFTWVEKNTPQLSTSLMRLGAIRDQEDTIRLFYEERKAIREYLEGKRNGKEYPKSYPKYNPYMLKAMDEQIVENKKLLYKMTAVLENELKEAAEAMGMTLAEAFPEVFSAIKGIRPPKHDQPRPEHQLQPGAITGSEDEAKDPSGQAESTAVDAGGSPTDQ